MYALLKMQEVISFNVEFQMQRFPAFFFHALNFSPYLKSCSSLKSTWPSPIFIQHTFKTIFTSPGELHLLFLHACVEGTHLSFILFLFLLLMLFTLHTLLLLLVPPCSTTPPLKYVVAIPDKYASPFLLILPCMSSNIGNQA